MNDRDGQIGMDFTYAGIHYNVVHLRGLRRLQLWLKTSDASRWEIGHAKNIPEGMTPAQAAEIMRNFLVGDITHETYNELLPGK